jgi:predicted ABC-type ATPase
LRTAELAVQRVRERVKTGGHNVPEDIIHRRYKKGMLNFFELYRTLADTWVMYDNSASGDPLLVAVGSLNDSQNIIRPDIWKEMYEA